MLLLHGDDRREIFISECEIYMKRSTSYGRPLVFIISGYSISPSQEKGLGMNLEIFINIIIENLP